MPATDARTLIYRLYAEVMGSGNMASADELVAPNYIDHAPRPVADREGLKQLVSMVRSAIPDVHPVIDQALVDGDKVAIHVTARGTHTGHFLAAPPTGKSVTWTETHIFRIAGGQVAEHWGEIDELGLLQQVGMIPAMG